MPIIEESQSRARNSGNLFYRINRDWFLLGSLFVNRLALTRTEAMAVTTTDPTVTGVSGYFRIAYRF